MKKIVVYIAMSLDGYIADKNGGVGFLNGDLSEPENQGSYEEFVDTVDTVILGYTTYNQIITELSPNNWPYKGKITYVLTSKKMEQTKDIIFINTDLNSLLAELKKGEGKDIWICGGASIVNQSLDMTDKFYITIIPTILGEGIRLFTHYEKELKLRQIGRAHV